jgi:DNA polymerase-4
MSAIFHVDMDAFFAAVEVRDDPSLRGKPVLVGGAGRRGVVAAASYEARAYGCHSAQPMAIALRCCPHAIVLPARSDAYAEASDLAFEVFERFSPLVEPLSIDEAFLDMSGTQRLLGPPRRAAEALRAAVKEATGGLTCSVGISTVKFLAKIASGMHKPDGVTEIPLGTELAFLDALPIGKLWGVGAKAEARLRSYGVTTAGDLRRLDEGTLRGWFGESGAQLHRLSRAIDPRPVTPGQRRKSISHEDTYAVDVLGREAIERKLLHQATRVADRLVAKKLRGRKVQLKIRDTEFKTETRQRMLAEPTCEARTIYDTACALLDGVELDRRRFRLTGVGVGALEPAVDAGPHQLELLHDPEPAARGTVLQEVLTAVRRKYGHQALYPADAGATDRAGTTGAITKTVDEDR